MNTHKYININFVINGVTYYDHSFSCITLFSQYTKNLINLLVDTQYEIHILLETIPY